MMTLNKKSPLDMGVNNTEEDNNTEINNKILEIIEEKIIDDENIDLIIEKLCCFDTFEKKQKKPKKPKTTKICKICKLEKPLEEFVINRTVEINRKVYFKNKCLECYKIKSKEYYDNNLKNNKIRYHKKKNFIIKIKYSNLEELENEFNKLKEKLINQDNNTNNE